MNSAKWMSVLMIALSVGQMGWLVSVEAAPPAAPTSIAGEFDYPELNVTPRASDRLESEAAKEPAHKWTRHLPLMFSGLTTFTAGLMQGSYTDLGKDPEDRSKMAGLVVGGGWLAVTAALSAYYNPYQSAQADLGNMPKKTLREQLTRERYAESEIQAAGSLARKLRLLSVLSNAAASGYMLSKAQSSSFGQVVDGVAFFSAFAPLVFRSYWQDVADQQSDYKKRIYAPVASTGVIAEPVSGSPSPAFFLSFFF